jgi:hypothetical protein
MDNGTAAFGVGTGSKFGIFIFRGLLVAWIICFCQTTARADNPEILQSGEIYPLLKKASEIARLKVNRFNVSENALFPRDSLAARRLVFSSNSILTISDTWAGAYILLMADEIELHGPATITWARREVDQIPPDRSRAPDGASGRGDGNNGSDGADGQQGNIGYPGRSAPSLYLFAKKIAGGTLLVDLRGEGGGAGGRGQDGGRGGAGAKGSPASQGIVDCKPYPVLAAREEMEETGA